MSETRRRSDDRDERSFDKGDFFLVPVIMGIVILIGIILYWVSSLSPR